MIQLTLNAKQFNIIKIILFFANFKRNFNLFNYKESSILTNATKFKIKTLRQVYENILKM